MDWSTKLAEEILRDHFLYGDQNSFALMLALRLRLVREEGYEAGVRDAWSVLRPKADGQRVQQ